MRFESHCEHHIAPIIGRAHIAYLPHHRVVGISKLARLVDCYAKRLQIQEKMTAQIANTLQEVLQPRGVAVVIDASHQCMTTRGVHKPARRWSPAGCWARSAPIHRPAANSWRSSACRPRPWRRARRARRKGEAWPMSWPDHRSVLYALGTFLSGLAGADAAAGARGPCGRASQLDGVPRVRGRDVRGRRRDTRLPHQAAAGDRPAQGFLLTALTWVVCCVLRPCLSCCRAGLGFTDAFFEAMSGLTTTGSTVMTGLDGIARHPAVARPAPLDGRHRHHRLAVMLLPYLRVGGMQLFRRNPPTSRTRSAPAPADRWEIFIDLRGADRHLCARANDRRHAAFELRVMRCRPSRPAASPTRMRRSDTTRACPSNGSRSCSCCRRHDLRADGARGWQGDLRAMIRDTQTQWYFGIMIIFTVWRRCGRTVNDRRSSLPSLRGLRRRPSWTTTGFVSEDYSLWGPFPDADLRVDLCRRLHRVDLRRDQGVPLLHHRPFA